MIAQVELRLSLRQPKCLAWFNGDVLQWWETGGIFSLDKEKYAANLHGFALNVLSAADSNLQKSLLIDFYCKSGPIFHEKELSLGEILNRLIDLGAAIVYWLSLLPAVDDKELMANRRVIKRLNIALDDRPLWLIKLMESINGNKIDEEWVLSPESCTAKSLLFVPSVSKDAQSRLVFQPEPSDFPSREDQQRWRRKQILRFFQKVLVDRVQIHPDLKDRLSLIARPTDLYSFTILWALLHKADMDYKRCEGKGCEALIPIGKKKYCHKCNRKYGSSYAKQRVLTTHRATYNKKDPKLYEKIKKYVCGLWEQGATDEKELRGKALEFIDDMKLTKRL